MILQLRDELDERESLLSSVNDEINKLKKSLEITKRERDIMTSQIETLQNEIEKNQSTDEFFNENKGHLEKIREKNQQLTQLLDELRQLEEKNGTLKSKVTSLSSSLNKATFEIETCTEDMKKLRDQHQNTLEMNKKLVKEKEMLMNQLKSLKDKVEYYEEEDLSHKLTTRIDEVIQLIEEKDNEIRLLKSELSKLKEEPFKSNVSNTESSTNKLTFDSIQQGNNLRLYLQDAARIMDEQNELIESLKEQIRKNKSLSESSNGLNESNKFSSQLNISQVESLESELLAKDSEISELRKQLFIYENQYFGLKEATAELKKSRQKEGQLQERIQELTNELNQLHMELTDCQDELDYIRECAKVKGIDSEFIPRNKDARQDKLEILKLQQQLIQLEEDKINLQEKVRVLARAPIDETISLLPEKAQENEIQLTELKEENEALQLGMKEILLALQRSDSKVDTVLDCPTLERLCQVLESRTVSPSLAPVIALKAELDLVRGNNEQLREELKRIRQEHLSLLAIYTEEILGNNSITTDIDSSNISHLQNSDGEIFIKSTFDSVSHDENKVIKKHEAKKEEEEEQSIQQTYSIEKKEKEKSSFETQNEDEDEEQEEEEFEVDEDEEERQVSSHAKDDEDENSKALSASSSSSDEKRESQSHVVLEDHSDEENIQIVNMQEHAVHSKPEFIELVDAEIQVDLKVEEKVEKRDAEVLTDREILQVKPEETLQQQEVTFSHRSDKCNKCVLLSRTIKDLMDRLIRLEERIKLCDDVTRQKVQMVQEFHQKRERELIQQVNQLQTLVVQKNMLIESLKRHENVPNVRQTNRRETQVITKSELESSSPAIFALPDISSAISTATSANIKTSSIAGVVEGVIECLESRIEHKESFIKEYEKRIREAKESFENEVENVISKLQEKNVTESQEDSFKILLENEMLKSKVEDLVSKLTQVKSESSDKIKSLESQLESEKKKLEETRQILESTKKRTSFNQVVTMKNELNHLQEEVKAKESVIESLHKRLQEERRNRIVTKTVKVKESLGNEMNISTINSFAEHLKEELERKEKQVKQLELTKWNNEKKYQDKIQELSKKLDHERDENGKLDQMVKRLKFILEKKKIAFTSPQQEKGQTSKLVSSDVKVKKSQQQVKQQESSLKEISERENELRILLQESLKREKVAALRLISSNAPDVKVEENLLQENARLKVDLRMAEFELSRLSAVKTR